MFGVRTWCKPVDFFDFLRLGDEFEFAAILIRYPGSQFPVQAAGE
jgi:hypothetical protein